MVLPKLIQLRNSLTQMMNNNLAFCEPLVEAILNGLLTRFGHLLDLQMPDAKYCTAAAISNPRYKLRWVPPASRESVRSMFLQCVQSFCDTSVPQEASAQCSEGDDDYGFNEDAADVVSANSTKTQVSAYMYLADAERSLSMLHRYPVVKATFIYYNTTTPSSAPVERLLAWAAR